MIINQLKISESRAAFAATTIDNTCIYAVGGYNHHGVLDSAEFTDLRTPMWISLPRMKYRRSNLSITNIHNSIYAFGGYNKEMKGLNVVERFDLRMNRWEVVGNMLVPRTSFGIGHYVRHDPDASPIEIPPFKDADHSWLV